MNNMLAEKLAKLGFTATEADVYLSVLKKGAVRAGEVIKDVQHPRSAVYAALKNLVGREFLSETEKRKVKTWRVNDPERLVQELEEKKDYAQNISEELKQLQELPAREVAVYEGVEGIERSSEKSLQAPSGETIYFLGPSKFGEQSGLEEFWNKFHKKRMKKNLKSKILYDRTTDKTILESRNKLKDSEARYLPFGAEMPLWFIVTHDNLAIVVPGEEPTLVFTIKSKSAAEGMKKYFNYFWERAV